MKDVTQKYRITDRNTKEAISEVEKSVNKSAQSSFEILKKPAKKSDVSKLVEGKRYIDKTKDGTVRLVFKVGNKLYGQNLSVIND